MSRTPRTLLECRFTTGYSIARPRQPWGLVDALAAVVCVASCVVIGLVLAKGM